MIPDPMTPTASMAGQSAAAAPGPGLGYAAAA